MPPEPKVVFDCNILVQAFLSASGPAASCIRLVENGVVTLLLSAEILSELGEVLNRPKLQRFATMSDAAQPAFEENACSISLTMQDSQ